MILPPRYPCKNCRLTADQHSHAKCLFQPTIYEPMDDETLYAVYPGSLLEDCGQIYHWRVVVDYVLPPEIVWTKVPKPRHAGKPDAK